MEKIEQIKAEIKRKYKSYEKILNKNINPFLSFSLVSRIEECKSVLSFIDSLEEPVSDDLKEVEAVIHPYDGEIWVNKDLLSTYDDCQRVKLLIIKEE